MEKYGDIEKLRMEFGLNKQIPDKYEQEILVALSHFPELKYDKIHFVLTSTVLEPYSTKPTASSFLSPKKQRTYIITILEWATDPVKEALFKNVDRQMRIGVLGHELALILQYRELGIIDLVKAVSLLSLKSQRRNIEREADKLAIEHGLGEQLLRYAEYIRLIPEYIVKRPEINENYLLPEEIAYYITHYKLTHVVS